MLKLKLTNRNYKKLNIQFRIKFIITRKKTIIVYGMILYK